MGSALLEAGSNIVHKYQGVASRRIINAVQEASAKTGVDFSFLMAKASAESGFNPQAKAQHSSARGLYQFISDTWLHMVKNYGDKFGLGQYADKIEIKNGKACVGDCKTRDAILNLRNNPEISALMAGAYSAENKAYLKAHTDAHVGATELSIAHFMGAGGAAKFLNDRAKNGAASAAAAFPHEAKVNKHVFYDASGKPRSLNEVYDYFAHRITGGSAPAPASATCAAEEATPAKAPAIPARSGISMQTLTNVTGTQALSSFSDMDSQSHIVWAGTPSRHRHPASGFSHASAGAQKLDASTILAMAELADAGRASSIDRFGYNS